MLDARAGVLIAGGGDAVSQRRALCAIEGPEGQILVRLRREIINEEVINIGKTNHPLSPRQVTRDMRYSEGERSAAGYGSPRIM